MKISILGDSISTYQGCNPDNYEVFYDDKMSDENGLSSANDTWWAQVINHLGGQLLINNSYSGSRVCDMEFPSGRSIERISNLGIAENAPDIILIYIGFNDFARGFGVYENMFMFKAPTFYDSYKDMILKIKSNYKKSKIICATLMKTYIKDNTDWQFPTNRSDIAIDIYNDSIKKIGDELNVLVADIGKYPAYETLDAKHPTKLGHKTIAQSWISELEKNQKTGD